MQLQITVTGAQAELTGSTLLTGGMVGLPVSFLFDDAWDGLVKTALFRAGGATVACLDLEEQTTVPWEVMKSGCTLYIGVYGLSQDGTVAIPTLWVEAGKVQPGADPAGTEAGDPTLPVWKQSLDTAQLALDTAQSVRQEADAGSFDGYSPVRGVDYWTEADIAAIRGYVDDAILGGAW